MVRVQVVARALALFCVLGLGMATLAPSVSAQRADASAGRANSTRLGPPVAPLPHLVADQARRVLEAAKRPGVQPWQRDFMNSLAGVGSHRESPGRAGVRPTGNDGTWSLLTSLRRGFHSCVYDPGRDRVLVFGGYDLQHFNDVWSLSLGDTPAWSPILPSGTPPSPRYYHAAAYDATGDRLLVFGGQDDQGANLNDVWALSLGATPQWSEITAPNGPDPRTGAVAVFDANDDRLVVYGGHGTGITYGDVWSLSLSGTPAWTSIVPDGTPPAPRGLGGAAYDAVHDEMVMFGGVEIQTPILYDEAWRLSLGATPAWTKIEPTGTAPSPRYQGLVTLDAAQDRLVIFGGYDGSLDEPYKTDVWELSLSTPAWTQRVPSGAAPSARSGMAGIFDPTRHRLFIVGGNFTFPFDDVFTVDLAGPPAWANRTPGGIAPTGREQQAALYDPLRDRMIVFGGYVYDESQGVYAAENDLWQLALTDPPQWTEIVALGTPPAARTNATVTYDPVADRLLLFGGYDNAQGSALNDLWSLPLSGSPTWTELFPANPPPARYAHTAVYDPLRHHVVVFGGQPGYNDTWSLDLSGTPTWTQLAPAGTPPSERSGHVAIHDPIGDRMVMFGGNSLGNLKNDTWELSLSGGTRWTVFPATGPPNQRYGHTAVYDPGGKRMLMYGGSRIAGLGDDLWALTLEGTPAWSQLAPGGAQPAYRFWHSGVYDALRGRLLVHGGTDFLRKDVWALDVGPGFPALTIEDARAVEGDAGLVTMTFTVRASFPPLTPLTVDYQVLDGTGTAADGDFIATPGTLALGVGAPTGTITVQVQGDQRFEPNETFTVKLVDPQRSAIARAIGYGLIVDDDPAPLSIGDASANEGNTVTTPLSFNVSVPGPVDRPATFHFQTFDGSATQADNDFVPANADASLPAAAPAYLRQWGTPGAATGNFQAPSGVALDRAGNVYVADRDNHRIQKFDASGNFLLQLGTGIAGTGNGQFDQPSGVTVDRGGRVYVADTGNDRIQKFDASGVFLLAWGQNAGSGGGTGDGAFQSPASVATDSAGHVYVADRDNHRIQKFDRDGVFLTKWGRNGGDGTFGSGNGEFHSPAGVAAGDDGNVYVADRDNHRVQKFDASGAFVAKWGKNGGGGTFGAGNAEFHSPADVEVDARGFVVVADRDNHRIQKLDASGAFLVKWGKNGGDGTSGSANGEFLAPGAVAVSGNGDVSVADTGNQRIQQFHPVAASGTITVGIVGDKKLEGNESFTVKLTNPANAILLDDTGAGTIQNDDAAPSVTVTAPNGGEIFAAGSHHNITWTATDDGAVTSIDLAYSTNGGSTYPNAIATSIPNTGTYDWTVPAAFTTTARVRATAHDDGGNSASDASNANFTVGDGTNPLVTVLAPNGGETFTVGASTNITWTASDNIGVTAVDLAYTTNFGASYTNIATNQANTGTYAWTIPNSPTASVRVRVTARDAATNSGSDASDGNFAIQAAGPPNLLSNGGFETNIAGWDVYGSAVLSRVADGHTGGWAMQMRNPDSGSFGCDDLPNAVPLVSGVGAHYNFSAWVRSVTNTGLVKIRVYELAGGSQVGSTFYSQEIPLTTSWVQLVANYTVRQAGTALSMRVTDATGPETFLVDDISITVPPAPVASAPTNGGNSSLEFRAQVSPNPASGSTTLRFATTQAGALAVRLFDVSGREVRRVLDEHDAPPGLRTLVVGRPGSMEPGIYFYRIEAKEGTLQGRFAIVE